MATLTTEALPARVAAAKAEQNKRAVLIAALVAAYFRQKVAIENPEAVEKFLALMVPKVLKEHDFQAALGAKFGNEVRRLEAPKPNLIVPYEYVPIRTITEEQVRTSIEKVGVANYLKKAKVIQDRDLPPVSKQALLQDARKTAAGQVAGAVARHAQSGFRGTVEAGAKEDPIALGWVRVTKASPCYFCATLASRGLENGVYSKKSFDLSDSRFIGDGTAKVHDNCVPAGTVVSGPAVEVGFSRRYEGEGVRIRTASGNELTITPNHPVLTDRGWIPAGLLEPGDNVVSGSGAERERLRVPDEYQEPSAIEDVLATLLMVGSPLSMPASAEQFHGDFFDSEVNVVASDGFFAAGVEAAIDEHLVQIALAATGATSPSAGLAGLGALLHLLLGRNAPGGGLVGSGGLSESLFGSQAQPSLSGDLSGIVALDAMFGEHSLHHGPTDAESLGDLVLRDPLAIGGDGSLFVEDSATGRHDLTGMRWNAPPGEFSKESLGGYAEAGHALLARLSSDVSLDRVVQCDRVRLSGHVYNLQTVEGWYSADGIIVSNCGCSIKPVYTESDKVLKRNLKFDEMWKNWSGDGDGSDLLNFRRHYEGRA